MVDAIHHGFTDLSNFSHIFSTKRIQAIRTSTILFQKAWLLNLDASRKRAQRKSLLDKALRGMQLLMQNFLKQKLK